MSRTREVIEVLPSPASGGRVGERIATDRSTYGTSATTEASDREADGRETKAATLGAVAAAPNKPASSPPDAISRRAMLLGLGALPLTVNDAHVDVLERAVREAGGLPKVKRGGTVLLKVNTNSGDPAPYSTSPTVLAWVARHYVEQGIRVIAGDRSFWGDRDTKGNLERNGIAPAGRRVGAEVIAFEHDAVEWTALDPTKVPHWVAPVRVPSLCFTADAVINLACAKTHFITGVTLGLKNTLGFVHADDRRREGNLRSHHPERIHSQYREIHAALPIHFTIIDGFDALVTGGPTPGSGDPPTIVRSGIVLASRDAHEVEERGRALLTRFAPQ